MTQFEMMTSTELSGKRNMLDLALQKLDIGDAGLTLIFASQRHHVVGHVQTESFAGRPNTLRRKQYVDALRCIPLTCGRCSQTCAMACFSAARKTRQSEP